MIRCFRLLTGVFAVGILCSESQSQVWEKLVVPGLTYRMEVDPAQPRMIHALRWSPNSDVRAVPELAGGTIFEATPSIGRETISSMAKRTAAVAVINADFFPFTGDPIGLMVRGGELLSLPYKNRSSFAWGPSKSFASGPTVATIEIRFASGLPQPIEQFNEDCKTDSLSLNTPSAGVAKAKATGTHAIIKVIGGTWKVGTTVRGEIEQIVTGQDIPIPAGKCILTACGTSSAFVAGLKPGATLEIDLNVGDFDWTKLDNAIGGGPNLVSRGLISTDSAAQTFNADFSDKRHPRTAMGRTAEGDLLFVAVDGRQEIS
ncbi:MAG: phosphodiester glycosidase family protein, partial [Fimbriimonadaceae bacterium]